MPQRRRRPRLLCTSRALPTGGFLMATAGQPRQCYQRSIRNPARASRSFNSVIRLSLAGTMFATVVTRRWSSLTVRHGWFVCAVRGLLHGGETCRVRVAERSTSPRTPSCHFAVCLQCHAGRHSALHWGVTRAPHSAVSVHPALRVGISGAEMIGQEHIRNVPVFGEVLSGCRCLATRLERVLGRQARHGDSGFQLEHTNVYYNATCVRFSHSPCCSHGLGTRYQRHRLRLDVVGYQAEGSDRRLSFSCATLPAA